MSANREAAVPKQKMSDRERFIATFNYGEVDRVFLGPEGVNAETMARWNREGLSGDRHLNSLFGFARG